MKETYYEVLEVSEKASNEIIKKAYNILVKKYHPDVVPQDKKAFAEEKIKKINEAYEILSNPEKRKSYDEELSRLREEENRIKYANQFDNSSYSQNLSSTQNITINKDTRIDYSNSFNDYLQNIKIKFKKFLKDFFAIFITILIFIIIGFIVWKIPYTHNKLLEIYNSNPVIHFFIDFITKIFN